MQAIDYILIGMLLALAAVYAFTKVFTIKSAAVKKSTNQIVSDVEKGFDLLRRQYQLLQKAVVDGTLLAPNEYNAFKKTLFQELSAIKARLPDQKKQLLEEKQLIQNMMKKIRFEYYKRHLTEAECKARLFDYQEKLDLIEEKLKALSYNNSFEKENIFSSGMETTDGKENWEKEQFNELKE